MMKTLEEQQKLYQSLWKQNSTTLSQGGGWLPDPEPIYTIGIWLPKELQNEMQLLLDEMRNMQADENHQWLSGNELHITLELPGRLGKHFRKEDIPMMTTWLQNICKRVEPFVITLGNISCFPRVPFREVYDERGDIYQLHDLIADKIPWSQHPEYRHENFTPHMSLCYPGKDAIPIININHPNFKRELPSISMTVQSIYFNQWYDGGGTLEIDDIDNIELGTGNLLGKIHHSSNIPENV